MGMYMHTIMSSSGRDRVLIILFQLYGTKAGLFKVICSGWVNMTPPPPHIGKELIQYQYPILYNLSK